MAFASAQSQHDARWQLGLSGCFSITDLTDGRDVTPQSRKACAVLAYLAARQGQSVPRDRLAALLWDDSDDTHARASLRQALCDIRGATDRKQSPVIADRHHVRLDSDNIVLAGLSSLEEGETDWVPLEDLGGISDAFDEWLVMERRRLTDAMVEDAAEGVKRGLEYGHGPQLLPLIRRLQRVDPLNEDFVQFAMVAEYQCGHAAAIRKRYREFAAKLRDELGVSPTFETTKLESELIGSLTRALPPPQGPWAA